MNKKVLISIVVLVALGAGAAYLFSDRSVGGSAGGGPGSADKEIIQKGADSSLDITITRTADGYAPHLVTIQAGETVRWVNKSGDPHWPASNLHPTHGVLPEFDPLRPIGTGDSWSFTFKRTGKWRYHDHLEPLVGGTVIVEE